MRDRAAVVTVGTELVRGLRLDTNGREIAFALAARGYEVVECVSVGDDESLLAATLARLLADTSMVVVTGGLGPTHDDITREAAAAALSLPLHADEGLTAFLREVATRHRDPEAAANVLRQAMVFDGAGVIEPTSGTAAGQVISTASGATLVLLPGPPHEMRPMLEAALGRGRHAGAPVVMRCVGITESDAQVVAQRALSAVDGVALTVLATPSLVDVVLFDEGGGQDALARGRLAVETELGDRVYGAGDTTLAQAVLDAARSAGQTIAVAESCTGGMVAAALTDIAGSSNSFLGGIVTYSDAAKIDLLGVAADTIARHGAVSEQTAREMARGSADRFGAGTAVAVTGIAGPGGATADKPVGTVWFALARAEGTATAVRHIPGDRSGVRTRATVHALDLLRREFASHP